MPCNALAAGGEHASGGSSTHTTWQLERASFELPNNYVPLAVVGKGSYGVVAAARGPDGNVAIKKAVGAFDTKADAMRTLREVELLRRLRHAPNVIGLKTILPRAARDKDLYIVYELMETDLHQLTRTAAQPLADEQLQRLMVQLLRGLKYLHSADVLHCDIKPSNLLINSAACELKICDFGLARTGSEKPRATNDYLVTRWYRAPELLLSCESYTSAIDMWSAGCVLAEMLGRRPLLPGGDYVEQLKLIVRVLGPPSEEDLSFVDSDKKRAYIKGLPPPPQPVDLQKRFPAADPLALDLLTKMLAFDPRKRITAAEALAHPWLASLHDEAAEPPASERFEFGFNEELLDIDSIRDLLYGSGSGVDGTAGAAAPATAALPQQQRQSSCCCDDAAPAATLAQQPMSASSSSSCREQSRLAGVGVLM